MAKPNETAETRNFRMHPKLLLDVIQRQAGTLSKAILEGVMNAVDAGATAVRVTLTPDTLTIRDDGSGFKNRANIEKFFEVFGQPHDASEGKVYGTFRMGRGQLMAFGVNEWRTGEFRMHVDIKTKGLDYDLIEKQKVVKGCEIVVNLYEPIGLTGVNEARRDIENWCEYVPMAVYFNDQLVSTDPSKEKWDYDTPEAHIKLREQGGLRVFNLGVHVCTFDNYRFGTGGVVVSKKQLKVNFARNDIQSDCPVWRKIKPFVDEKASLRSTNKKSLNDGERQRLADKLKNGEIAAEEGGDLNLFTAVTGRHFPANDLIDIAGFNAYSNCPRGDRIGDTIMRRGIAFVFADETLDRFGFETVPEMLKWVAATFAPDYLVKRACKKPFKPFDELSEGFKGGYVVLKPEELTPREQLWLKLLDSQARKVLVDGLEIYASYADGRKIVIGESRGDGWTDGETYVAIARDWLKEREMDVKGLTDVGILLTHEACHEADDTGEHDHDQAFHERFHDAVTATLGDFLIGCIDQLPKIGERLSRKVTRAADAAAQAKRASEQFDEKAANVAARNQK